MTFAPRCGDCLGCSSNGAISCINGTKSNVAGELLSGGQRLTRDGKKINHHLGVSAFADYAVVDCRSIVKVDSDIPAQVAALLGCAVLTGGGALINAVTLKPGQSVAVVGLGGVGLAALITAIAIKTENVYGIDLNEKKRIAISSALFVTGCFQDLPHPR